MQDEVLDKDPPKTPNSRSRRSSMYSAPIRGPAPRGGSGKRRASSRRISRGDLVAIEDFGDTNGALRKNKAFQQLRREMEQRNRQKRKMNVSDKVEVFYVDRDRAAAVALGNKDIKNELLVKKKRDRMENSSPAAVLNEDVEIETYLLQGEHELKSGEPRRAAMYLTSACDLANDNDPTPFALRSKCYSKLGLYDLADHDADVVLNMNPQSVKGLLNKAESQYNMGRFEHAMKYFSRANRLRPDNDDVFLGIRKSQDAIENSLCLAKAFNFDDLAEIIDQMILEQTRQDQRDDPARIFDSDEDASTDDSEPEESLDSKILEENKALKARDILMATVPELEGLWTPPLPTPRVSLDGLPLSQNSIGSVRKKDKQVGERRKENATRKANKELLGELYKDRLYLENLIANPILNKFGRDNDTETFISFAVQSCAREGIVYLDARKDFWQQQKPVYARERRKLVKK